MLFYVKHIEPDFLTYLNMTVSSYSCYTLSQNQSQYFSLCLFINLNIFQNFDINQNVEPGGFYKPVVGDGLNTAENPEGDLHPPSPFNSPSSTTSSRLSSAHSTASGATWNLNERNNSVDEQTFFRSRQKDDWVIVDLKTVTDPMESVSLSSRRRLFLPQSQGTSGLRYRKQVNSQCKPRRTQPEVELLIATVEDWNIVDFSHKM